MASGLGALVVRLGLDAADFVSGASKAEQQLAKLDASAKKNAASINRQVKEYQKQAAMLGMSSREAALYELRLKGANAEQLKAANTALKAVQAQEDYQKIARATGIALGVMALGAVSAATALDGLVKGAADFQDLAEEAGGTAEGLASLAVAAGTAGVEMSAVAGLTQKLVKGLTGVDDESKAAGAAIEALGLNVEAFKRLAPEEKIDALTAAFSKFSDEGAGGQTKLAAAQALVGKQAGDLLKLTKVLDEQGGRSAILTQQQIELADQYADSQAKSRAELLLYAQAASTQAAPALLSLTEAGTEFLKTLMGVDRETGKLGANTGVKDFAEGAVRALGFVVDAADGVARVFTLVGKGIGSTAAIAAAAASGDLKAVRAIIAETQADAAAILNRRTFSDALGDRLAANNSATAAAGDAKPPDTRKQLRFSGAVKKDSAAADALAEQRRILDAQLRDIRAFNDQRQEAVEFAQRFLDNSYDAGTVSLRENLDEQRRLREVALQSTLDTLDKEIAARKAFAASLPKTAKEGDRAQAETALKEAVDKRAAAVAKAEQDRVLALQNEQRQIAQLRSQYADFVTELKSLRGDDFGAASDRIERQVQDFRRAQEATGGDPGLVDEYRARLVGLEQINEAQRQSNRIRAQGALLEDEVGIRVQRGQIGQLEALRQIGAARQAIIPALEQQVLAEEALARASGNPDLILNAQRARVELEKLKAAADPLGDAFRDAFGDAFRSPFRDLISGAKSGREALYSFIDGVAGKLQDLAADEATRYLFGREGIFGQAVGQLGNATAGGQQVSNILPGEDDWMRGSGGILGTIFGRPGVAGPAGVSGSRELRTESLGAASALNALTQAANGAAGALGAPVAGTPPGLRGIFSVFDTSGAGTTSTPSAERDVLRRMEAQAMEDIARSATQASAGLGGVTGASESFAQSLPGLFDAFGSSLGDLLGSLGGGGGGVGSLLGLFGGFFADGGRPPMGKVSVVGEKGPELFVPDRAGTVVPTTRWMRQPAAQGGFGAAGKQFTFNMPITVPVTGNVDRGTAQQIAAATAKAASEAVQRRTAALIRG